MSATATPKVVKQKKFRQPGDPTLWDKIVRRKWLFGSILFHIILAIITTFWVIQNDSITRKKFMKPAGSADAARQGTEHKVSLGRKQSTMSAPEQAKRVTTNSAFAKVALPEMPELPTATTEVFANRALGFGGAGEAFGATGSAGGGGGGGGSGINFFGLRTRAKSIVILMDCSDSMVMSPPPPRPTPGQPTPPRIVKGPQTYAALEREVARVIRSLPNDMSFSVVVFAGQVEPYKASLVKVNPTDKENAIRFIQQRNPALNLVAERKAAERADAGFTTNTAPASVTKFNHGGTLTSAALDFAFAMNPDAICIVSDGVPTDGGYNGKDLLEKIKAKQKQLPRPAVINVIAYLADSGQQFMQALADQNQGSFKEIKPGMQSFGF